MADATWHVPSLAALYMISFVAWEGQQLYMVFQILPYEIKARTAWTAPAYMLDYKMAPDHPTT
jgi:hypothetical protein